MSKKDKLIPELRFGEFQVVWEALRLGSVCKMKSGSFVPAKDINEKPDVNLYPCYGGNGLRGYTKSYTHKGKYSLIGRQGALCGNVNLVEGTFHATEHAVVVKHNERYSTDFLFYTLNNQNLNRYATGQAQPGLSVSVIESIRINIPSLPEQQKIASFLSTVDKKINLLESKIEHLEQYKKGVVQKIFKQEIRFKITNEEDKLVEPKKWRRVSLNEVAEKITKKNVNDKFKLVLTNSAKHGILKQGDFFDKEIANQKNLQGYTIVQKGDFVYNPRISSLAPVGPIGMNHISVGVMSPLYTVFRFSESIDTKFYECYFNSTRWYKYLRSVANYGARHDRMNISSEDFFNLPLPFPEKEEQTKIANFLSKLDQKIDLHKEQLEKMKTWKKGLLQKMFV